MATSILLAKVLGLIYTVIGLAFLLNSKYYKKTLKAMIKDSSYMFYGGITALAVGFFIVNAHNVWVKDWTVIVTIFGWASLVKGLLLLLTPKTLVGFSKSVIEKINVVGFSALILGVILGYYGFFV